MLLEGQESTVNQPKILKDYTSEWHEDLLKLRLNSVKQQICQQNSYISTRDEVEKESKFSVGQLVRLRRNPPHKLASSWIGPYKIVDQIGSAVTLQATHTQSEAPTRKAHLNQIAHYHRPNDEDSDEELPIEDPNYPVEELIDLEYDKVHDLETAELKVGRDSYKDSNDQDDYDEDKEDELKEREYRVEKIISKRLKRNRPEYLVQWAGYDENDNTWEPLSNLDRCQELIAEFEQEEEVK